MSYNSAAYRVAMTPIVMSAAASPLWETLTPKQSHMILRVYRDGLTIRAAVAELGNSDSRGAQLIKAGLRRLGLSYYEALHYYEAPNSLDPDEGH